MFLPLPAHSAHHENVKMKIILLTILKKRQQKENTVNRQTYLNSPRMSFEKGKHSFATCTLHRAIISKLLRFSKNAF